MFGSRAWLRDEAEVEHPLNKLLFDCYRVIMLSADGSSPSDLVKRSMAADRERGVLYYSLPEEVCARAFEAWVQDARIKNHFLVKGTKESPEAKAGLYPLPAERIAIGRAFSYYFATLGKALNRA
ncbi:LPD1 domain-containing protein [Marinobacterium sp. YM272]|uniref:LPD1 domain-containing protein n=1 Tax=Marinobacterium sp. YM272 TaxID=3421654 RepID=UPI003D7FF245